MPQELNWKQKRNEVIIEVSSETGEQIVFIIGPTIINYLAGNTPKFYIFFVKLKNENEKEYFVDLNGLKPVASANNSLRVTLSTNKKNKTPSKYRGMKTSGMYCIARGESFYERYLTDGGWKRQKSYFDLFNDNQANQATTKINKTEHKTNNPSNNLTAKTDIAATKVTKLEFEKCKNCSEEIPTKFDICPYCNTENYKQSDSVDIMI